MDIAIAGSGYVGLVTAAVLADIGHTVTSVDVDAGKIRRLAEGGCPIYEPGLRELLEKKPPRLRFTTDPVSPTDLRKSSLWP